MDLTNYNNYLQLFALKYNLELDEDTKNIINTLTKSRTEFIKRCNDKSPEEKRKIVLEILNGLNLDDINKFLSIDFNDKRDEIENIIKSNLKKPNVNSDVIEESINFCINVLNNNLSEFKDLISYFQELANENVDTKRDEIITDSIIGIDKYNYYLVTGSTIKNSSSTTEPLFDISILLEEEKDERALPIVQERFSNLLNISSMISSAFTPEIKDEKIEEDYKNSLSKYNDYIEDIDNYNQLIFKNKALNQLYKKKRENLHPDILIKLLYIQDMEAFLDNKYGFDLLKRKDDYTSQLEDEKELDKMTNIDEIEDNKQLIK